MSHRLEEGLTEKQADSPTAEVLKEVVGFFNRDLVPHFAAEEEVLFPAMERHLGKLAVIAELLQEHRRIESLVASLGQSEPNMQTETLRAFGELLHDHIRKEERVLFPIFEEKMPESAARAIGDEMQQKLRTDQYREQ